MTVLEGLGIALSACGVGILVGAGLGLMRAARSQARFKDRLRLVHVHTRRLQALLTWHQACRDFVHASRELAAEPRNSSRFDRCVSRAKRAHQRCCRRHARLTSADAVMAALEPDLPAGAVASSPVRDVGALRRFVHGDASDFDALLSALEATDTQACACHREAVRRVLGRKPAFVRAWARLGRLLDRVLESWTAGAPGSTSPGSSAIHVALRKSRGVHEASQVSPSGVDRDVAAAPDASNRPPVGFTPGPVRGGRGGDSR